MTNSDLSNTPERSDHEADPALDALLGRAKSPVLSSGFTAEVLRVVRNDEQTLSEASAFTAGIQHVAPRSPSWLAKASAWGAVAAALMIAAGSALWQANRAPECAPESPSSGDEALMSALQTLDLKAEDFAIVAQLGEVLEAELTANNALWLEPK